MLSCTARGRELKAEASADMLPVAHNMEVISIEYEHAKQQWVFSAHLTP